MPAGAEANRRLATCSVNTFALNRLPFAIQSPMVLVLDRKSLDEGQIIGLLQEGDVLGASLLEFPWVMLPEGSFVRHPKMRQGRIKLLRSGWLISQHPQYGELMHALSMDQVRKLFSEEAFAKLPLVKEAAQAAKATSNRPVQLEDDLPATDSYPGAKSSPPKPSGATPTAAPKAALPAANALPAASPVTVVTPPLPPAATATSSKTRPKETSKAAQAAPASASTASAPASTVSTVQGAAARQGRSEAALVSGVPRRPWAPVAAPDYTASSPASPATPATETSPSVAKAEATPKSPVSVPKAAPKSPSASVTPKASSNGGVSSTLAKMPKQTRAAPELCQRHLQMCNCEHWKVIHTFVFVRSDASLDSEPLAVLREGSLLCAAKPEEPRSSDGKWARLGSQAKVWSEITSDRPDFVALGREGIFVLIHKADVGDLIRLIPKQAVEFQRQFSGSSRGVYEDLSKLDHWVVLKECRMVASREEETAEDFLLEEGDVLRSVDHSMARIFRDGSIRWLHVPAGSQVFKAPDQLPALAGGLQKQAYVKLEVGDDTFLRRHKAVETGTSITEVSSYGEPWVVEHQQVVVRRGPSIKDQPLGVMIKGDVVGVRRRHGDWLELVQDCEVRFKKRESPEQPITAVNPLRRHKDGKRRSKSSGAQTAWMMVEHPELGQLMRRARKRKGGLGSGCVLSPERLQMYQEVVELCHRRIYKENLESLWDGEAEKLPTLETIEAKLFDEEMEVLHVTQDGKFTGGALVKELSVKARHVEGSSNLNLAAPAHHHPGTSTEILGTTTVGYIDSMASEEKTQSGRVMWDFITGMPFICLACHSILRQKTVDFWQARGMRHMDPSNEKDCTAFRQLVMVHTMGKVICELKDLQEALPKSKLPLFVWVPSRFTEEDENLHDNYIFKPDDEMIELIS